VKRDDASHVSKKFPQSNFEGLISQGNKEEREEMVHKGLQVSLLPWGIKCPKGQGFVGGGEEEGTG